MVVVVVAAVVVVVVVVMVVFLFFPAQWLTLSLNLWISVEILKMGWQQTVQTSPQGVRNPSMKRRSSRRPPFCAPN